jgi:hypothetical protein
MHQKLQMENFWSWDYFSQGQNYWECLIKGILLYNVPLIEYSIHNVMSDVLRVVLLRIQVFWNVTCCWASCSQQCKGSRCLEVVENYWPSDTSSHARNVSQVYILLCILVFSLQRKCSVIWIMYVAGNEPLTPGPSIYWVRAHPVAKSDMAYLKYLIGS